MSTHAVIDASPESGLAPAPTDPNRKRRRSRMIRAILAGGLVLGVGAAVTLAAWNDSEFATGTFSAGTFDLEGSLDNSTFGEHNTSGSAAVLVFTTPANLSPTDVVAAPFAVRLAAGTTNNATVSVITPTVTGTTTGLTYEIDRIAAATPCTSATVDSTGTPLVAAGTPVNSATGALTFPLTKGATLPVAGTSQLLCIKVTAGAIAQGQTGTVTWQFTAASV